MSIKNNLLRLLSIGQASARGLPADAASDLPPADSVVLAPTRAGKGNGLVIPTFFDAGATIFDMKASIWAISRTSAKKRLMAAGLRPGAAAGVVRAASAKPHWFQGGELVDAMKHHRRHAKRWFPFDTLIVADKPGRRHDR